MEKQQYVQIKTYLGAHKCFPKLTTAKEVSDLVHIRAERLLELAESGHAPCVRIDNGPPLFFKDDIVSWCRDHLLFVQEGKSVSKPVALAVTDPDAVYNELPEILKPMFGNLKVLPAIVLTCVYFLVKGNEVVYVGQSVNLSSRILTHFQVKDFDKVFYLPVPRSELNETEGAFIRALKPRLNASNGPISSDIKSCLSKYGVQVG